MPDKLEFTKRELEILFGLVRTASIRYDTNDVELDNLSEKIWNQREAQRIVN